MSLTVLPNKEFKKLVKLSRDKEFKKKIYKAQEPRKIDWPAYNISQIRKNATSTKL